MEKHQQQELELKIDLVPAVTEESTDREEEEGEEEESELSVLLNQTFADITDYLTEEEATAYIASILEGSEIENITLFENITPYLTENMKVTNYRPDQAVREASLAQKSMWRPGEGEVTYLASNTLEVYLGTPEHPLELPQAMKQIR